MIESGEHQRCKDWGAKEVRWGVAGYPPLPVGEFGEGLGPSAENFWNFNCILIQHFSVFWSNKFNNCVLLGFVISYTSESTFTVYINL